MMDRFKVADIYTLEKAPTSPARLRSKVDDVIAHSRTIRAEVKSINADTGEYRLVLQGTLSREKV